MNPNQKNYHIGRVVSNAEILDKRNIPDDNGKTTISSEEYLIKPLCCPDIRGVEGQPRWIARKSLNSRVAKGYRYCKACALERLARKNRVRGSRITKKQKGLRPYQREENQVYIEGWGLTLGRMGMRNESTMDSRSHRAPYKRT